MVLPALAGMLVYPAVTEKAQCTALAYHPRLRGTNLGAWLSRILGTVVGVRGGRMCADDLFLVDDDKYCSQVPAYAQVYPIPDTD
eukprot:2173989-Rhodomonas_salina.2